jgi:hypothetical protein
VLGALVTGRGETFAGFAGGGGGAPAQAVTRPRMARTTAISALAPIVLAVLSAGVTGRSLAAG